jgi:ferric-dicitrate binding protein FerR (iron transport regulator)
MNENEIENTLRHAPRLKVPRDLRETLEREIDLPRTSARSALSPATPSWLRRWMPAAGFAVWFLAGVVVLGIQAQRIKTLREEQHSAEIQAEQSREQARVMAEAAAAAALELEQLRKDAADAERLRAEVERLRAQAAELAELKAHNQQLRDTLKAEGKLPPKPEEDFFATIAERATRSKCINNLKQVALAARIWANEHGDVLPADYDTMKAELGGDRLTFCPKDKTTRYEILSPGASELEPQIVYLRCRAHNIVAMVDGSVQQLADSRQVVQRDGKWVLVRIEFE